MHLMRCQALKIERTYNEYNDKGTSSVGARRSLARKQREEELESETT